MWRNLSYVIASSSEQKLFDLVVVGVVVVLMAFMDGAVLLLSSVSDHYSKPVPRDIGASMNALHKKGILHGNTRLENVVGVVGNQLWCVSKDSVNVVGWNRIGLNFVPHGAVGFFLREVKPRRPSSLVCAVQL